jgi:iron complex outermembrane receptor protein
MDPYRKQYRKSLAGGLLMAGAIASLLSSAAAAQDDDSRTSIWLPRLDVVSTRISATGRSRPGRVAPPEAVPGAAETGAAEAAADIGIVGASTSVITAQEIERSPASTVQDLIAREPGVQTWSTFGGVNGAGTTIDLRGFGASAASNTLVLINGRRLTDIDLAGVDFSAIPRESIERIEIIRGNSGAVLYGDGAVGGVVNIVTKKGVNLPPSVKIGGAYGTFQQREGNIAAAGSSGPFAASVFANAFNSDGYRVNNALQQRSVVGDFRYAFEAGSAYVNVAADDQELGLPGARRVTLTSSELETDRRGATTPTAFANKQGISATAGFTHLLLDGLELIVDGGVREKKQQAFSEIMGFASSDARMLTTYSFTPRVIAQHSIAGMPSRVIAGLDFYDATLNSNRGQRLSDPPVHRFELMQRSVGIYGQQTVGVTPNTDLSWGARVQHMSLSARDRFDPMAPGAFFDAQAIPLDTAETQHALHLGMEHRASEHVTVFGRVARSFRTPNVDERVGVFSFPVDFNLRTQTSRDIEGGVRVRVGPAEVQTSVYDMRLTDEIHFNPSVFANINLDPTRRYGAETNAVWRVNDRLIVKGGAAYTRSVFRAGPFAGNDVPLVSRWTASGALSWDIWHKQLVFDAILRYIGKRRMDNDQRNFQPLIPAHTLVDVRLGGEYRNLFWSFAIQNLFDVKYFDYAVASPTTFGTYNAYPQPGRMFLARLGVKAP